MNVRKRICYFSIDLSNPYGENLLKGFYNRCLYYDYNLLAVNGGTLGSSYAWEYMRNELYHIIRKENMDALIVSNIFGLVSRSELLNFLTPFSGIPIVTLSEKFQGIPCVRIDNAAGFRELFKHLIEKCFSRSFAAITGPKDNFDSKQRLGILMNSLCEHDLKISPENIYEGDFSGLSALAGIKALLDGRKASFDTLVCFNDLMAVSAMEELKRRGYRIPEELKITGFDNSYESAYTNPPLTTVNIPVSELCETAVDKIHKMLAGHRENKLTLLPTSFIPRQSSGIANRGLSLWTMPESFNNSKYIKDGNFNKDQTGSFIKKTGDTVLNTSSVFLTDKQIEWFRKTLDVIIRKLFLSHASVSDISELLDLTIYSDYIFEWSAGLWSSVFLILNGFLKSLKQTGNESLAAAASAMLSISEKYRTRYTVHKFMNREFKEKYLLQLGGELGTAFDLGALAPILEKYAGFIGIESCFVVMYADPSMNNARLVVHMKNKRCTDVSRYKEFPARKILPGNLYKNNRHLIIDALHVRDEQIGYIVLNAGEHPGMIYESLRHKFSSAIKGVQMVSTINRYSEGLEKTVEERTKMLTSLNEEMKDEIKKREIAENELLRQKNLESLGLLAGGIAHDFNNILTALSGNVSLLIEDEGTYETRHEVYNTLINAINNARNLTGQLLTFSKGGIPVKKTMHIIPIIEEAAKFLLHGSTVKPEFDFEEHISEVDIDQSQISQVLNNLIINSIQAMPDGGTIKFKVRKAVLDEDRPDCPAGDYLNISIADTGTGIPEDSIDKIFYPYFSTKNMGSGLGLSTSLNIIRKHGGDITASSAQGKGSVFEILLPVSRNNTGPAAVEKVFTLQRGLNVLVLEDNNMVAEVIRKLLIKDGEYCTLTSDGYETVLAYQEARNCGKPFDLVIADLTIPGGMGGAEVIKRILKIDPEVRSIVTSGYNDVPVLAEYKLYGFKTFLKKPFTSNEFKKSLLEALK